MGEELAMVLYLTEGEQLSEEELRDYLKSRLASYKIPKYIRFSTQPLPQNASGKLHKLKAKEAFLEEA
jgi:acyl-CoA synthetase (AMP-forming)/AMP-acid ligase II